jgi:3-hydroxybutyrate dehydrogenase
MRLILNPSNQEITMLKGKTALVTGSTSGIGLGIARQLAAQGVNIVLNGFGDHAGPQKEIQALGVQSLYHGADMSRPSEVEAMMQAAAERFGRVDILVNNAGIQHVASVQDFPTERWDAVIAINLSSAFHTTRLALPAMLAADNGKGWGRIINIASAHGLVGSPLKSAYVAAKHGIVGLTKVTALETATTGVTCNAICPALHIGNEEASKLLLGEKQPSMQFTTPDELGELAVYLCGNGARNVRGVAWQVDGGWTAQ